MMRLPWWSNIASVINDVWWWLSFFTERPVTRIFYFIFYIHIKNNVCIKVRVPRHTAAAVHWYIPGHDGLKKHVSRLHSALHCTTYRMQPTTLLVPPLKLVPSLPLLSPLLVLALHFEAVRVPASMHTMHNVQQLGVTVLIKINTWHLEGRARKLTAVENIRNNKNSMCTAIFCVCPCS